MLDTGEDGLESSEVLENEPLDWLPTPFSGYLIIGRSLNCIFQQFCFRIILYAARIYVCALKRVFLFHILGEGVIGRRRITGTLTSWSRLGGRLTTVIVMLWCWYIKPTSVRFIYHDNWLLSKFTVRHSASHLDDHSSWQPAQLKHSGKPEVNNVEYVV